MRPEDVEALMQAGAAALGLDIAAAHRPGVLRYLALAAAQAELLNALPLMPADEPAPVFSPLPPAGGDTGALPLLGVPFAVKNLFDVQGLCTRAGSKIECDAPPAARDALLVRRLEAAGAILVGTLNMDEYAYGFTSENTHYGPVHNPHDLGRTAGGSSGGSGAALAAGQVPLTLGSDTNGSIRVPASLCGVFGLKPTYGRLPRSGSYPFVASLDVLGPLARGVADLALAYDAMQGPDAHDSACAGRAVQVVGPLLERSSDGLRLAVLDGYFMEHAGARCRPAAASNWPTSRRRARRPS